MYQFLIIFIYFNIYFSQSFFTEFISHNQVFVDSPIKSISFNYQTKNIEGLSESSNGSIIIGDDIYKLSLKNYIFLIQKTSLRRYNKKTNQIFIENHNIELDSLILNFFKIDNLNKIKIDSDGVVTDFDSNLDINDFIIEFKFSEDSSSIKNLNISYNQYSLYLDDMVFLNERLDSKDLLSFKFPNAFTFDLRD